MPEQFLPDGGHFELSPMYHCILLFDVLDLVNLANISGNKELVEQLERWRVIVRKALSWLKVMTHPDGEITFFNDATKGIAVTPDELISYAVSLNLVSDYSLKSIETLPDSGYTRISLPSYVGFFDHARIGPSYLPGHGHADTLSVELSVGKERVLVNSGTSVYGLSKERQRQRGTEAHNTVIVDSEDSSEVWGGFRVARRATCKLIYTSETDEKIIIKAQHDGYKRLRRGTVHERELSSGLEALRIIDTLSGNYKTAYANYHLHPDVSLLVDSDKRLILNLKSGRSILVESSEIIEVFNTTWHPGFGVSIPNKCLRLPIKTGSLEISFSICS